MLWFFMLLVFIVVKCSSHKFEANSLYLVSQCMVEKSMENPDRRRYMHLSLNICAADYRRAYELQYYIFFDNNEHP